MSLREILFGKSTVVAKKVDSGDGKTTNLLITEHHTGGIFSPSYGRFLDRLGEYDKERHAQPENPHEKN